MTVDFHQLAYGAVVALLVLAFVRVFRRWNADKDNTFDVRDLFMENGRASKGAIIMWGAFAATTAQFVYYTFTGKLTEGYFTAYSLAWIAPTVVKIITRGDQSAPEAPK